MANARSLLLLITAVGCAADGESDSEHYIDALSADSEAEAAEECAAMEDVQLRGDCRTAVAQHLAEEGHLAEAEVLCASIIDEDWRDECWFGIADAADPADLTSLQALELCSRAGQFTSRCNDHLLHREVMALDIPVGQEARAATQEIGSRVRQVQSHLRPQQRRLAVSRYLGQAISQRWEDVPFDPSLCGAVSEVMCRYAYTVSLAPIQGKAIEVCETAAGSAGGRVTSEATQAAGLSGFIPAGAALAQGVWATICADIAAGRMDPYEVGAFAPPGLEAELREAFSPGGRRPPGPWR